MNRPTIISLLAGLGFLAPISGLGLPEDREQPIQLEADRAQLDQNTGVSIYEGNVIITQGSMRLFADTATIYVTEGEFERMEAKGNPVRFRYKPAADKEEIFGRGQYATYDIKASTIVVTTDARFTQGGDVFTGEFVEYDLDKDLVKAKGGSDGGRVLFTIQPRSGGE
jgi:lipopolysaccharide export system protein LptA